MKILLTGGSGQLGKSLISCKPRNIKLLTPSSAELDLNNAEEIRKIIKIENPDWIINSGAYTDVDKAEIEKESAIRINAIAPKIFSETLQQTKGKLLHISTDYVFDGNKKTPYLPSDFKNPMNIYGQSKALAEESIQENLKSVNQFIILRTSWVVSPFGRNFILSILNLLSNKKCINVVNDQIGSMTSSFSLANICWELIKLNNINSENKRIFPAKHHWCNEGFLSWFDLANAIKEIAQEIGLIKNPAEIKPISSDEYNFAAKRPKYSVLNCHATEKLLNIKKTGWKLSLYEILIYIQKMKKNNI